MNDNIDSRKKKIPRATLTLQQQQLLAEQVEQHSNIWDKSSSLYKDAKARDNAWNEISEVMRVSGMIFY